MRRLKLYIDSNVWISYLWIKKVVSFPKKFARDNKRRERSYKIISSLLNGKKVRIIFSLFNESEISGYFRDYLRFVKGLSLGYDYTNSHKYKENFLLSKAEKEEITSYFEYIASHNLVEVVEPQLDEKSLTFFRIATCGYYLDYIDALHLLVALMEGCKYLITEDKDFRQRGNGLLRDNKLISDLRIVNGKEILRLLKLKTN